MADGRAAQSNHKAALIVAHPGHELRVHHWLETTRPLVCVLTDGSGHTGRSRLESSTRVLTAAGARIGPVYGGFTDHAFYAALLRGDFRVFSQLADDLAAALIAEDVSCVASDTAEGYNPAHDVCRLLANSAVTLAAARLGHAIEHVEFPLTRHPAGRCEGTNDRAILLRLDDSALNRKMQAARNYGELASEVDAAVEAFGINAYRVEGLCPADPRSDAAPGDDDAFYELDGERQVTAGHYSEVVRYATHILPLARALRDAIRPQAQSTDETTDYSVSDR